MGGGASKGNQTPRRLSLTKPPPQQHPQYPQHPQFPQHPQYPPQQQHPAKQRPGYDSQSPSPPMKRHIQPSPSTHTLKSNPGYDHSPQVSSKGTLQKHKLNNNDYGNTDSDDDSRTPSPVVRAKKSHKRSLSAGSYRSSPTPTVKTTQKGSQARRTKSEEQLAALRLHWNEETAKRIHVVVRVRPLSVKEIRENAKDIIFMDEINNECTILVPKPKKAVNANSPNPNKSVTFTFDRCYKPTTTTAQIYNEIPYALVQSVLDGYNATIMAYGQTGSGKSFTMQEDPDNIGVIPRAIVHIFEGKERDEDRETIYTIHVSYVEIYNEEVRDLLSTDNRKLEVKGNQGTVADLTMHHVESIRNCADLLRKGIANRITSATTMNAHSSRSHAIFTVWTKVCHIDASGHQHYRKGKLNLVDLAGSERHGKTGISNDSGQKFTESKSINLSLSTLGKVIQCLSTDKPGHVPYRESKLTRILQDSLGGNARTLMIACLSPADSNFEETLSTLKYAHNTKFINNRPVVNSDIDPKDELIKELQNEIKNLRDKLQE